MDGRTPGGDRPDGHEDDPVGVDVTRVSAVLSALLGPAVPPPAPEPARAPLPRLLLRPQAPVPGYGALEQAAREARRRALDAAELAAAHADLEAERTAQEHAQSAGRPDAVVHDLQRHRDGRTAQDAQDRPAQEDAPQHDPAQHDPEEPDAEEPDRVRTGRDAERAERAEQARLAEQAWLAEQALDAVPGGTAGDDAALRAQQADLAEEAERLSQERLALVADEQRRAARDDARAQPAGPYPGVDTAAMWRELSALGQHDRDPIPRTAAPARGSPAPAAVEAAPYELPSARRRRGLFGRA